MDEHVISTLSQTSSSARYSESEAKRRLRLEREPAMQVKFGRHALDVLY
jgi:hypothetical protein